MTIIEERAFLFYRYYIAIKLHFDKATNYDFFKNQGRTKVKFQTFRVRKDYYFFEKAANSLSLETYLDRLVTAAVNNPSFYIRELFSRELVLKTFERLGRLQEFEIQFRKDLQQMLGYCLKKSVSKDELLIQTTLTRLFVKNHVSTESMVLLSKLLQFERNDLDPLTSETYQSLTLYSPFIQKYLPTKERAEEILEKELTILE